MTPAESILVLKLKTGVSSAYVAGYLMCSERKALAWIREHGGQRRRVGAMKLWTTAAPNHRAADNWNARA